MEGGSGLRLVLRCVVRVLSCILGLGLLFFGIAPTASADEPDALASISLSSISPSLPKRDGTITLSGRVTNTSEAPLVRPQALLWRDQAPIVDGDGLQQALDSDPNQPLGRRLFQEPGAFQNLYTADKPNLEPGRSATFSVSARVKDLALAPTDGVYLIGVHVLQNRVPVAVARTRVLVPVLARPPQRPVKTATVVVLNSQPSILGPGLLSDEHLAREVANGGRLRVLLGAAQRDRATYAVDPALVAELETMRAGYQVRDSSKTSPGQGQADAARWLAEFSQLQATHDGYRLLFGSPDVAALAHAKQPKLLKAAADAGKRVGATSSLPLLVLPTGGEADLPTLRAAESLDPRAVLLSDRATDGEGPLLRSGSGGLVIYYTAGGAGGGPGPDPRDDAVHLQQRALASSWIDAISNDNARAVRVQLIQTNAEATASGPIDPPWSQPAPLRKVLDTPAELWSGQLHYETDLRGEELSPVQIGAARKLDVASRTWQDLLVNGDAAEASGDAGVARAVSGSWRGQLTASATYVEPQQTSLDYRLAQVRISSTPKTTTTAQQGIAFPITVRNELLPGGDGGDDDPMAIHAQIRFNSDNSMRLKVGSVTTNDVAPDGAYTGNAQVTAKANGTVPVTAQLYTEHGYKVGRPVTIEVHVTQNGTTGLAIAVIAGVVLVASTAWRIRQVSREKAAAEADQTRTEPALSSVPSLELEPAHSDTAPGQPIDQRPSSAH